MKWKTNLILILCILLLIMNAEDILNNTDPQELRNILKRLKLNQDAGNRPPPMVVVNEAPGQYPPSTTADNSLGWFIVTDYGAVGDGAADDTSAVNATIAALNAAGHGVLYFPAGSYKVESGLTTITAAAIIMGDGMNAWDDSQTGSQVIINSATATLFTVNSMAVLFRDLSLVNTAGTVTAGAGIFVSNTLYNPRVNYEDIKVDGFYIGVDIQNAYGWKMSGCLIYGPTKYGIRIRNTVIPDAGNWVIISNTFSSAHVNSDAAIRIESSGGGRIEANKIIEDGPRFNHGIDLTTSTSTSILQIIGNSIENIRGDGVHVATSGVGAFWDSVLVMGNQFGLYGNSTGNAINVNAGTLGQINNIIIEANLFEAGTAAYAISLTNVNNVRVYNNMNFTFGGMITTSGCTNVTVADPGTSVVTETSYGQASAVGTSSYWAREDHTHGSPSLSANTAQAVGSSGAAGSGTSPSKDDHVHQGLHSLAKYGGTQLFGDVTLSQGSNITITQSGNDLQITSSAGSGGELLMQDGVSSPPVPLTTEDGTDWLYQG